MDLETLLTEYNSAKYEARAMRVRLMSQEKAETRARSALVDAIIEAGLTEYGPITSSFVFHEPSGTMRRVWRDRT